MNRSAPAAATTRLEARRATRVGAARPARETAAPMVERVLPDRRTAMTPVALAAAITRTGGRRVEVPYLPPPEPPPRFCRM
jgi:hypothetical protein